MFIYFNYKLQNPKNLDKLKGNVRSVNEAESDGNNNEEEEEEGDNINERSKNDDSDVYLNQRQMIKSVIYIFFFK